MAGESQPSGDGVHPVSEQVHLPPPSYLPVVLAVGVTIALVGVVMNWVVFGLGFLIFLVSLILWIRGAREEISRLPLEH